MGRRLDKSPREYPVNSLTAFQCWLLQSNSCDQWTMERRRIVPRDLIGIPKGLERACVAAGTNLENRSDICQHVTNFAGRQAAHQPERKTSYFPSCQKRRENKNYYGSTLQDKSSSKTTRVSLSQTQASNTGLVFSRHVNPPAYTFLSSYVSTILGEYRAYARPYRPFT